MENLRSDSDLTNLVRELSVGRDLAKQLQNHLNLQPSSSHESREFLLQSILYSYDHALSMLTHNGLGGEAPPLPLTSESPLPLVGSPHSDESDQDFKDKGSRKRKTGERRTEKVKVSPEAGIEGQLDDGYGWRKYGQKDILGAKYPRGYYRCTYRHTHGCLATKQVQRSDEDPTIFEITYGRQHTCNRANAANNPPLSIPDPHSEDPSPLTLTTQTEPPFNIQTIPDPGTHPYPFGLPTTQTFNLGNDQIFSDCNDILGNYYPDMDGNYGELVPNLRHSESELSPIVAAMTSATNSATIDTDFPFGQSGFVSGFDFGDSGHYP